MNLLKRCKTSATDAKSGGISISWPSKATEVRPESGTTRSSAPGRERPEWRRAGGKTYTCLSRGFRHWTRDIQTGDSGSDLEGDDEESEGDRGGCDTTKVSVGLREWAS